MSEAKFVQPSPRGDDRRSPEREAPMSEAKFVQPSPRGDDMGAALKGMRP
jgi:hypothetical protein